jgi:hypothetical protein
MNGHVRTGKREVAKHELSRPARFVEGTADGVRRRTPGPR